MTRPDTVTIPRAAGGAQFAPHPEGQHVAVCVDVIDLGERVEEFPGSPTKVVRKVALVFASGERKEDGTLHTVSAEYTASAHEKASLRQTLESWRGKRYTDAELDAGLPLHKLAGHPGLILVEHMTSKAGRTFAKLRAVTPIPKAMKGAVPNVEDYTRAPYWTDRKEEYAAGVRKYRAETVTSSHEDAPHANDQGGEDDLPFD